MIKIAIKKNLRNFDLEVDLTIKKGEFVAIGGRSGSGKTTLLRVIAGLEKSKGKIIVDDEVWQDERNILAVQKREIGFVAQDYALFENMSVLQNLLYVKNDKNLANHLLDLSSLTPYKNLYPKELSGGQKQRTALIRAMMRRPKILLLDEPLSALDPDLRSGIAKEIINLHKEFGTTTIMVSHYKKEIYNMADRYIKLDEGKITYDSKIEDSYTKSSQIKAKVLSNDGEFIYILIGDDVVRIKNPKGYKIGEMIKVEVNLA